MTAVAEHEDFDVAGAPMDGVDLGPGTVLVLLSLDDQDGRVDPGEELFQVPAAERRVEPGTIPAPERGFDVPVVSGEPAAQIARLERLAGFLDAAQAHLLGEHVRRLQQEGARLAAAAGMDD